MPFDDRDFPNLPRGERAMSPRSRRLVAVWLYGVAAMILVMVALGGATRLTGSGLSIMEWAPIMGAVPPLTDTEWHRLFDLYKQIPQYSLVNDGFGLDGFKRIFWLEWSHRLWGRLMGAAFLLPMIWFAATGRLERWLKARLVGFFVLGGLQGAVGWFMVASGFLPDSTAVAPVRLVLHLVLALVLYAGVLWTAMSLWPPGPRLPMALPGLRLASWVLLGMTGLTIAAGGLVAGLHAGLTYNTFPLMDGELIPPGYFDLRPAGRNLIENAAAVQFDHRVLAAMTLLAAIGFSVSARWVKAGLGWRGVLPAAIALPQFGLGIATLVLVVPPALALAHQIGATLLLTAALIAAHGLREPLTGYRRRGDGQVVRGIPLYRFVSPSAVPPAFKDPKP